MDVISREELYDLVWSMPMTKVAEKFDVSGSFIARVCSILSVPRPERGYWAKLAVGKAPTRPPLSEAQPGDPIVWTRNGDLRLHRLPKPSVPRRSRARRVTRIPTGIHGLVRDAKTHFESGRPVDEGKYLKPYKRLLVDVTASKTALDKALAFTNDLFNALEAAGHRVVIAPQGESFRRVEVEEREQPKKRAHHYYRNHLWWPARPTVVYVGTVAVGLAIVEMSKDVLMRYIGSGKYIRDSDYVPPKSRHYVDHSWTTTQEIPTGRLRLIVYSPYWRASWSRTWQESDSAPLTRALRGIVRAIEDGAVCLVDLLEKADRQAEIERRERLKEEERERQEEDQRRIAQSIKDSQAQLDQVIQAWSKVMSLEQFFQGIQDRAQNLPDDKRDEIMERLQLAREFVGTQDPLNFFSTWKTPTERYVPLSMRSPDAGGRDAEDDDE